MSVRPPTISLSEAAPRPPPAMTAIDFWGDLDRDVLDCFRQTPRELSPAEIGDRVGISEDAARSVLTMLAQEGKVRICSVACVTAPSVI